MFRLLCEKINKNERKNKAEIINETPGDESSEFWRVLGDEVGLPPEDDPEVMFKLGLFPVEYNFFCRSTCRMTLKCPHRGCTRCASEWVTWSCPK
jgi:hypothetical protein